MQSVESILIVAIKISESEESKCGFNEKITPIFINSFAPDCSFARTIMLFNAYNFKNLYTKIKIYILILMKNLINLNHTIL